MGIHDYFLMWDYIENDSSWPWPWLLKGAASFPSGFHTKGIFFSLNTSLHLLSKGKRSIWWRGNSHSLTFLDWDNFSKFPRNRRFLSPLITELLAPTQGPYRYHKACLKLHPEMLSFLKQYSHIGYSKK